MKVDIYTVYKVKHKCKYSYREYDDYGDIVFKKDKFEVKREMQGGELMELVAGLMKKENADTIECADGVILISEFNPFSGETSSHKIEYKEKTSVFDGKVKNEKPNN